jgi:hypothetical protein
MRSPCAPLAFLFTALLCLLLLGPVGARVAPPPPPADPGVLAITNVTVIDATGAPPRRRTTVLIRGERIVAVGPARLVPVPRGARVLDGRGRFLIPGLWDMHTHITHPAFPRLFLAHGVTGVRHMFSTNYFCSPRQMARQAAARQEPFPRLFAAEQLVDGPASVFAWPASGNVHRVRSAGDARRAVRALKARGEDFVKVYDGLSREAYFELALEAWAVGLPFAGHVPYAVNAGEASDAGQSSIEHLSGVALACSAQEEQLRARLLVGGKGLAAVWRINAQAYRTYDPVKAEALFRKFAQNGTWQVPTLVQRRVWSKLDDPRFVNDPRLAQMPDLVRQVWQVKQKANGVKLPYLGLELTKADLEQNRAEFRQDLEVVVPAMRWAGVRLLAGTDASVPYCFPGSGLHDELELLVEAGLNRMEALQAATRNPAEFLGRQRDLGTVERGKLADLVLLDASPLEDIRNTRRIRAVVLGGRVLDREALDAMLPKPKRPAGKE